MDDICKQASDKLRELLCCGNERVELAAAKELLARADTEQEQEESREVKVEVEIKIAGEGI